MSKVNLKIIALSLFSIFIVCMAAFTYMERVSSKLLVSAAESQLEIESELQAQQFNRDLREVERTTSELVKLVEGTFDMAAFKSEAGYMERYMAEIEKIVARSAQEALMSKSAYIYFVPELDHRPHDIWYADLNFDGVVERQAEFPISYYDGDLQWKQWYYMPYTTHKPYWTEPYMGTIEADQDIVYFSNTAPIFAEGRLIGIAGADYYFNHVRETLGRLQAEENGYAALVDQSFNVLVHPQISSGVNLLTYADGYYSELLEQIKLQSSGIIAFSDTDDREIVLHYTQLDNGWYFMMAIPRSELYAGANHLKLAKWGVVLLGLVAAGLMLWFALRKRNATLEGLSKQLERIADANYEDELSSDYLLRKDDVGELALRIETLRQRLRSETERQHADQGQLEGTVLAKTVELMRANEYLEISLAQLQEQHAEVNIAMEKYEQQSQLVSQLQNRLYQSEQLASLAYVLIGLAYDLNSPIGNTTTVVSYLKSERANLLRLIREGQLKKADLEEFTSVLGESLELLERNLALAGTQIAQFKRLSEGSSRKQESEFRVKETLHWIFAQTTLGLQPHVKLSLSIGDISAFCDLGAFVQVFANLMKYSLTFSYPNQSKGLIHIRCESVGGETLMFVYEDYGVSSQVQLVNAAFVPSLTTQFQEQPQTIPLNICYHIITKVFEGSIKFEQADEQGNKFFMILKAKHVAL